MANTSGDAKNPNGDGTAKNPVYEIVFKANGLSKQATVTANKPTLTAGNEYRFCANAKANGALSVYYNIPSGPTSFVPNVSLKFTNATAYTRVCSANFSVKTTSIQDVFINHQWSESTNASVRYLELETVSSII